jgi:hypothetical protein
MSTNTASERFNQSLTRMSDVQLEKLHDLYIDSEDGIWYDHGDHYVVESWRRNTHFNKRLKAIEAEMLRRALHMDERGGEDKAVDDLVAELDSTDTE